MPTIFYPAIVEPILPESLRPEVIDVDSWQPDEVQPIPRSRIRPDLAGLAAPDDLLIETILPDKWHPQEVIPTQYRTAFFQDRGYLSELTTFEDLFAIVVVPALIDGGEVRPRQLDGQLRDLDQVDLTEHEPRAS